MELSCWCSNPHAAGHMDGPTWYESEPLVLGPRATTQIERDELGHVWIPWMRENCAMFWLCTVCKAWRYAHICGAPDPIGGPWYYKPGSNPSWDEQEDEPFGCT